MMEQVNEYIRNNEIKYSVGDKVIVADTPKNRSASKWRKRIGTMYTIKSIKKRHSRNDYFIKVHEYDNPAHSWFAERFIKIEQNHFNEDLFEL